MTEIDPATVTENDVYVTRAFQAPRDVVWKFFTEPQFLAQWFGPSAFSVPIESVSIDLRVGGHWNLNMRDDVTGDEFPMRGAITVCEPPEYLEMNLQARTETTELEDITLRIQFHDHGEKTRVTLHQGPFEQLEREQTTGGWELSFQKLDAILETQDA
jgi:uncharacterized protein YndB with AHSA1/START domain